MGRIVGPFGVQGWLRFKPFTEDPAGLDEYAQWIVRAPEGWIGLPLEGFELHSGAVANSRDSASASGRGLADATCVTRDAGEAEQIADRVDLIVLQVRDHAVTVLGRVEGSSTRLHRRMG